MDISLRERILNASRDLFFEQGYYKTTTRNIAQNAQTSESGIFRLFESKYSILMAVYNNSWEKVNHKIDKVIGTYTCPKDKIMCIANTVFLMYESNKKDMSFIIMNTGNTDTLILERKEHSIISNENQIYIERLSRLAEDCSEKGLINPKIDAQSLCEGVMSIIEGCLLGWYLADTSNNYPYKLSIEQALCLVEIFFNDSEEEKDAL